MIENTTSGPYRLAIAISGAVSLGSYEAGVMFEIIRAIKEHNAAHELDTQNQIKIDVITGASAGGMTAAILAACLLYDAAALEDPYTNAMYRSWVEEADLKPLLALGVTERPAKSFLSSRAAREIGWRQIVERVQAGGGTPHLAANEEILLGLAVTNLQGLDYQLPMTSFHQLAPGGEELTECFTYTRFEDTFTRKLDPTTRDKGLWTDILEAALASGAFPLAFRPRFLKRVFVGSHPDAEYDYGRDNLVKPGASADFPYIDGGVLNNYPLGYAKTLADKRDREPLDKTRRFYLYVAPRPKAGSVSQRFAGSEGTVMDQMKALVHAVFQQAQFQDWILTDKINAAIRNYDKLAARLAEELGALKDLAPVGALAGRLKDSIYSIKYAEEKAKDVRTTDREYLRKVFAGELRELKSTEREDAFLDIVQLFRAAMDLENRDEMRVYTVVASDEELAGDKMSGFIGFFNEIYRRHDYDVGRKKAIEFLRALRKFCRGCSGHLQLMDFTRAAEDLEHIEIADVGDADLCTVPEGLKKTFIGNIYRSVMDAVLPCGVGTRLVSWLVGKVTRTWRRMLILVPLTLILVGLGVVWIIEWVVGMFR